MQRRALAASNAEARAIAESIADAIQEEAKTLSAAAEAGNKMVSATLEAIRGQWAAGIDDTLAGF